MADRIRRVARGACDTAAMAAPISLEALAAKLSKAKHPRETLRKATGGETTDVLWSMLAAGLIAFRGELADAAGCCAEHAKLADVWASTRHLDEASLREESVRWAYANSYRANPDAWERELPDLPAIARVLVAHVRPAAVVDTTDRERLVAVLALAAADQDHTYKHALWQDAVELGEARDDFARRSLRHVLTLPRRYNDTNLFEALRVATWDELAPILRTWPERDRDNSQLLEMLATRDDAAAQLAEVFARTDAPIPSRVAELVAIRESSPSAELDPGIVERLADGGTRELVAKIEAWPVDRREALVAQLREHVADRMPQVVGEIGVQARWLYGCASLLRSPILDDTAVAEIVGAVATALEDDSFQLGNRAWDTLAAAFRRVLEFLVPAGAYGAALVDRALATLEARADFRTWYWSSWIRIACRRRQFAMTGRIELVMPNEDLPAVSFLDDVIGDVAPLPDELVRAWRSVDWDGSLGLGDPSTIETRAWDELAPLVAQTSFTRFRDPAPIARVLARPEPIAVRLALAERIAARAKGHLDVPAVRRGIANVLVAVPLPRGELAGDLAQIAKKVQ